MEIIAEYTLSPLARFLLFVFIAGVPGIGLIIITMIVDEVTDHGWAVFPLLIVTVFTLLASFMLALSLVYL